MGDAYCLRQIGLAPAQFGGPFRHLLLELVSGFTKLLLASAQRFLGSLPVGDIGAGPEPLDDVAVAVPDRHAARLKPAVPSLVPAHAVFHVIDAAPRHRIGPHLPGTLPVVAGQDVHPAPAGALAPGDAGVFRPWGANVIARAVRRGGPDQLRQRLGQAAPALLILAQGLVCDAALVVHRARGAVALLVQRVEASAP